MKFEFRVNSDHFSWDDLAFPEAVDQYTSKFWPFGRQGRAREKLLEEQNRLLEKHDIEKETHMGITTLIVDNVENKEDAIDKMNRLKDDIEEMYSEEFGIEQPFEFKEKERTKV